MSTDVSNEAAREALRRDHDVRLVTSAEEGSAAEALPPGVFGFTASPVLASPLFAVRRYRNFEVHRLANGVRLIGFVSHAAAAQLTHPTSEVATVKIFPDVDADAPAIVAIPYDRIVQHRQYAVRNAEAISLQVMSGDSVGA
jgi:hypothetical protein